MKQLIVMDQLWHLVREYGMGIFNRARRAWRWMAEDKRQKRQRRRESIEVGARQQRQWAADGDGNQRWRHMGTTAAPDEWQRREWPWQT
jgi:hypothetical protein